MSNLLKFVPRHSPCDSISVSQLQCFIDNAKHLFVLTGAGISTESGIPDYRSEGVGLYATSNRRPILIQDFINSSRVRQRYWARNYVAWPRFSSVLPNIVHNTITFWQRKGKINALVTQNVDSLHQKAGSVNVDELHGTSFVVHCLSCGRKISRHEYQDQLKSQNGTISEDVHEIRPDGDVELSVDRIESFTVPACTHCGGIMKPYIVFFGDSVPGDRVLNIKEKLASSDSLLVLGSSLTVYSSFRYILQGYEQCLPICIVNIGETRADKYADLKISGRCGEIIPKILIS